MLVRSSKYIVSGEVEGKCFRIFGFQAVLFLSLIISVYIDKAWHARLDLNLFNSSDQSREFHKFVERVPGAAQGSDRIYAWIAWNWVCKRLQGTRQ